MPLFRRESRPASPAPTEAEPIATQTLEPTAGNVSDPAERRAAEEAERRVQEAERLQGSPEGDAALASRSAVTGTALFDELRQAEENLATRRQQEELLAKELEATEARLAEGQRRTEEALERAAQRLKEVEQRAAEAEARASRAERLAALKAEELERESRLREILDRIAEAEGRASAAEERARSAVSGIGPGTDPAPPPTIPDSPQPTPDPQPPAPPPATEPPQPAEPQPGPAPVPPQTPPGPGPSIPPDEPPEPPDAESQSVTPNPEGTKLNLNSASYDELRSLGLSVTQTGRVLAQREHKGSFNSADELDEIPGFPGGFLAELKSHLEV